MQYRGKMYRAFNLTMTKQGVLVVLRRFPAKDAHLSRKRGVGYLFSKEKFTPTWTEELEYLGCCQINLNQLAPCRNEEADPARTINLPDKKESMNVHLLVVKPERQQAFADYNTTLLGKKIASFLEKEAYPHIGVIITSS